MPDESGRGSSLAQRGPSHSALPIHAAGHGQGLLRPRGLARKPHAALAGARPATPAPQPDGACRCAPPFPLGIRPVLPHEKVGETLSVNAQRRGVPGLKRAHKAAAPIPQVSIHASVHVCMCVHTPVPRLCARSPCPYTTSPDSSSEDHEKNEPPTSSEASGSFPGDPWRQSVSSCSCIPRPCCCQINFTKVEDAPVTATALSEY